MRGPVDHRYMPGTSDASGNRGLGRRPATARSGLPPTPPTLLVAGIVRHLAVLRGFGNVQRARWPLVRACATRRPADLVILGQTADGVDARTVIDELRMDATTRRTPILHAAARECPGCLADLCWRRNRPASKSDGGGDAAPPW